MRRRNVLLALLAVELSVSAVLYRGGWLSRAPQSLAPPPLPAVVAEPPTPSAPITRVTAVDVRRGDTLVRALTRQGIEREASAGIAAALAASGANLKKLSPRHTLEVTSTLDGRPVAQYVSDGRVLSGVGFERAGDGRLTFYDLQGRSLRKSFLKSPLEFTRITSGFTWARPHPILGGVRPHLAIDYGAPTGTPVRAVADGRVGAAGWSGGNGISVTLRHRSGNETMYNHLSRLAAGVRPGGRVTQRQVIGYVGATGLATGPHLDYRVSKNGHFVNPLGEKFIPGEPIAGAERGAFTTHARELVRRLEETAPF